MSWTDRLSPYWRVQHGFAPIWLPAIPNVTDTREWNVKVDPEGTVLNKCLPKDGKLKVSLHRLLIETGIALTPATTSWDPRSWFALYWYGLDFAGTSPKLRFNPGFSKQDPRLTAVASEEISIGITCYLLREYFALDHIADVFPLIKSGDLEYVDPGLEKRPDFFCEDCNGETVLAESKGATGTRCSIEHRIDPEGLQQVQNVRPATKPLRTTCSRVVIGTHFCVQGVHKRSETTTIIKDPDGPESRNVNPDSDVLMRLAYAKVLRFSRHDELAERIFDKNVKTFLDSDVLGQLPTVRGFPVLPLCELPFGGVVCMLAWVAKDLFFGNTEGAAAIRRTLDEFRESSVELAGVGYALSNGIVIVFDENSLMKRGE